MANVGRAHAELLRWLADDFFDKKIPSGYTERIDAALREAAQQERERLTEEAFRLARLEFKSGPIISDVVWLNDVLAILAEPSE